MYHWLSPEELDLYEPVSRSMRIEGYSTSVRLERIFWDVLDRMAAEQHQTVCGLVGSIYQEMHNSRDTPNNFTSILRVICLKHLEHSDPRPSLSAHATAAANDSPAPNESAQCPSCGLRGAHSAGQSGLR